MPYQSQCSENDALDGIKAAAKQFIKFLELSHERQRRLAVRHVIRLLLAMRFAADEAGGLSWDGVLANVSQRVHLVIL